MINLLSKKVTHIAAALLILLLGAPDLAAQNRAISGMVKDAEGQPVIGAAVVVVGQQSLGVMTGTDGKYAFSVPAGATIEVSCIGYVSQTAKVGSKSTYDFVLAEDSQLLEETVVIGYGVQKKSDLTGSVASVKSTDLKNRSTSDAAAALQGKAAGVQILNYSGAPGSGAAIRVRGYSSNSGNIGPLLIVDGLKVDNIQYLDPSMIENMEILKDAASAAIYGAEAGNGVVLITTKSGAAEKGRVSVSYDGKAFMQSLGKKAEVFDAQGFIDYKRMSGLPIDELMKTHNYNGEDTDWYDEVFEPSWSQQHAVTFAGGNNRGNFFAALNMLNNDGIVKGQKDVYKRLSAQINADYKLYDWLTVGANTSIEKWNTKSVSGASYGSLLSGVIFADPLTPTHVASISDGPADWAGKDPKLIMKDPANGMYYAVSKYQTDPSGNPLLQMERSNSYSGGISVRGTLYANFTPIKYVTYTSRLGYRISQSTSHNYSEPYYANSQALANQYSISANANTGLYYQWENFVNYNQSFGKHNVGAMAGMSYIDNNWDNVSASASGTDILRAYAENFRYLDYVNSLESTTKSIGNAPGVSRSISYFGRLSYSYDNRYSLQANFRADAFDSSKLSKQNRWGYFPSVSAGWTVSNESFVKDNVDQSILSFLKLRGSWGLNGNINVLNNYQYTATIDKNSQWYQYSVENGTQTLGSGPTSLANPDLRWETSEQIDLGLDARLLNNRLSVALDWYRKMTRDLLVTIAPVSQIGVKSTTVNAGNVLNSGLEIELGWKDQIGDFSYSVNANMATLHNEVTFLSPALDGGRLLGMNGGISGCNNKVQSASEVGYPLWYFRGYKYAGVCKEDYDYVNPTDNKVTHVKAGAPLYYDKDGKVVPSVSTDDLQYLGSAIPKATYGLTLSLAYKGFDLNVFGTGTIGNKIFNLFYRADTPYSNSLRYYKDNAWSKSNPSGTMPDPALVSNDWTFWSSDASMFNGSYFKFKQIQLGYSIPAKFLKKVKMQNLRVYASMDDWFTISSYPGMDPETATTSTASSMGYDYGSYPTTKKLIFGVNITF